MKHVHIDIIFTGSILTEVEIVKGIPSNFFESMVGQSIKEHATYKQALSEVNKTELDDWLGEFN